MQCVNNALSCVPTLEKAKRDLVVGMNSLAGTHTSATEQVCNIHSNEHFDWTEGVTFFVGIPCAGRPTYGREGSDR